MLSKDFRQSRVVIVDDVIANSRLLESSLRAFGLRDTISFSDSAAALDWLQHNPWSLLLLDLDMPAPNGFDILRALADRDRSSNPIIIITALNDAASRRTGLELGANDYLSKPVDLPEVILRVRSNLQLSQASLALQETNMSLEQRVRERTAQLNQSYGALVRTLCRASAYRDSETGNHIVRIGESAALIAEAHGMSPEWVELMRQAAPMHDVGKIGIADHILLKPGPLNEEERQLMQQHPAIGHSILTDQHASALTDLAAEIALSHHEKWDGSGYPNGLKGEQIPLSGRIVAICDVYDALRMPRPYKEPWPIEKAQAYIREQAGKHFDPQLVALVESLYEKIEALQHGLSDCVQGD
ncbi:HD domain-containing protein [Pseudomonas indoloxydans]|uniref:HD domain-containing protein n=1 Tax=Ectopseudomonas oleovorans TaxID=301 RepID=A0A2T5PM12_ECTOL|nr:MULTISPECIES: HD domain-containing phosphohydrolase [Pseudomonas]OWK39657.1 Cyclic di-GMP phosphodiesterase response regulator RpfG [Pseudomonas oleovorans subsp. oleovorans]PTU78732.1 HD domain-containing protein [Pseudomonas indoloxydans]SEK00719.1 putative two-component system response regulator [Pseudomonas oleovorans]SUD52374.1 response regulator receiver modulated metal dependent phosphohydrolase [Pseudomonas oleovorans]